MKGHTADDQMDFSWASHQALRAQIIYDLRIIPFSAFLLRSCAADFRILLAGNFCWVASRIWIRFEFDFNRTWPDPNQIEFQREPIWTKPAHDFDSSCTPNYHCIWLGPYPSLTSIQLELFWIQTNFDFGLKPYPDLKMPLLSWILIDICWWLLPFCPVKMNNGEQWPCISTSGLIIFFYFFFLSLVNTP